MANLNVYSPWVLYVKKLQAFFNEDPSVSVRYDEEEDPYRVLIFVDDQAKYCALSLLLKSNITFGNVDFKVDVIPANFVSSGMMDLFRLAFKDSPIVESIDTIQPEGTNNPFTYISFKNEVVQYHSDTLGDPHGNTFTLYQDLAEDIFAEHGGVYFTTLSK